MSEIEDSNSTGTKPHQELQQLRIRLQKIYHAILGYQPLTAKPPILDLSLDVGRDSTGEGQWLQQEHIPGLRKLRDAIKIDVNVLEKFLDDPASAHLPPLSTNAPYLIAVWNEVQCAHPRIDAIFKTMSFSSTDARRRGTQQPPGAKVDIVANNGRHWIRVNTIKNARLLAEFREIDSYLTESDDDSDESGEDVRPTLAQTEFDNSILRMGRSLLEAAKAYPIESTTEIPRVTLRLTRLDPSSTEDNDPRIGQTLHCLQDMGIDVGLGERRFDDFPAPVAPAQSSSSFPAAPLEPTAHINLDLSVLIALISDITHSTLPETADEASNRFIPSQQYREWKQRKNGNQVKNIGKCKDVVVEEDGVDGPKNFAERSRALTNQLMQEMRKGLLQEIHDRISTIILPMGETQASAVKVKFWTTPEARDRCLRIVSKIGGPSEKCRAHAMFYTVSSISTESLSQSQAEELYWQHSRYPSKFIALFPINLYPPSSIPDAALVSEGHSLPLPRFFQSLSETCKDILVQETIPHPRALPDTLVGSDEHRKKGGEIQRAIVTKANPRLTAHTVQSLLWGAELGWTTLTANKTSVKAILRETKVARVAGKLDGIIGGAETEKESDSNKAAIWIVDPRSLAEGMSSRTRG